MQINYTPTSNDLLLEMAEIEKKISQMKVIISQLSFSDISIMFFTRSKLGERMYHCLRQDNFEFNLEVELTKLLMENYEQLNDRLAEKKTHYSQITKKVK